MSKKSKSTHTSEPVLQQTTLDAGSVEVTATLESLTEPGNETAAPDAPTDGPPSPGAAPEVILPGAGEDLGNETPATGAGETTTEAPKIAPTEDGPQGYPMTWQEVCGALGSSLEDTRVQLDLLKKWCAAHTHPGHFFVGQAP